MSVLSQVASSAAMTDASQRQVKVNAIYLWQDRATVTHPCDLLSLLVKHELLKISLAGTSTELQITP